MLALISVFGSDAEIFVKIFLAWEFCFAANDRRVCGVFDTHVQTSPCEHFHRLARVSFCPDAPSPSRPFLTHAAPRRPPTAAADTLVDQLLDDLLFDTVQLLNREERAAQIEAAAADEGAQLACAVAALDAYAREMDEASAALATNATGGGQHSADDEQEAVNASSATSGSHNVQSVSAQPAPVVWLSQPHATATSSSMPPVILPSVAVHPTVDRSLFVPMAAAAAASVNQNVFAPASSATAPTQLSSSQSQTQNLVKIQPQQPFLLALPLPRGGDASSVRILQQPRPMHSQSQSQARVR